MIVICGEAVIDLVPERTRENRFEARPGGSPVNTAVTASRLGSPVAMMARLSRDEFGEQLRAHLVNNDVDVSGCVSAAELSSVALATIGPDGGADYRFLIDGAADWQWTSDELARSWPREVVAFHTGSLALAIDPGAESIVTFLTTVRNLGTISLDPNVRADLIVDRDAYRARIERVVALADVVKVSAEDLTAIYPGMDASETAAQWARNGPGVVVMTDGGSGSLAISGSSRAQRPADDVEVIDTIGAGDAFSGAILDWLWRAGALGGRLGPLSVSDLEGLLRFATRVAGITCSRVGADPPRRGDLSSARA